MGAGVVKPGLGWDGSEGNGCAGFAGRAVAGVDVAPTDFSAAAIVPVAGLSSAGGFGLASLSCWISVRAFAGALCPASAMGLEPGFDSDGSGGGEVAGADAAGFCNRKPFSSATDSALEPVGGAGAGVAGVEVGLAAEGESVVSGPDSAAAFDGAGPAESVSSAAPAVGAGVDFKAEVSCTSAFRSVFDEPDGVDFAILEALVAYAVGEQNRQS